MDRHRDMLKSKEISAMLYQPILIGKWETKEGDAHISVYDQLRHKLHRRIDAVGDAYVGDGL